MKKIYAIALAAAVMAAAGCGKKDRRPAEEPVPRIDVATVVTDSVVLHKTYPGTITAATSAEVVGEVNGRLLTQNYKDGAFVSKGQTLFTGRCLRPRLFHLN